MFIRRLINQGNAPLLEAVVRFGAARQRLLADNVANLSTPNYRQKDLSVDKFQALLQSRAAARKLAPPGSMTFDDINGELTHPSGGILFHDGNNRSLEQLMTDQAKNAMMHNLAIELLRRQFTSMENALKERIS